MEARNIVVAAMMMLALPLSMGMSTFGNDVGRYSKDKYCNKNPNHTLCLYQGQISPSCGEVLKRGLTDDERELVVRLHNERRAFIANGLEARGDPGPQPMAANMMELVYDEELEYMAQTWTDQCVRNHECPTCRNTDEFRVGQNLFWFGHFTGSWEKSVKGWYDEVADFNSSFVYPFYVIPGVLVGHFTQMTWAQTTKIGCGKLVSYPDRENSPYGQEFYICDYGLAGNLIKSEMYKVGAPCSKCPAGTSCSETYPGLCSGVPTEPLTIRPPKYNHDFGLGPTVRPVRVDVVHNDDLLFQLPDIHVTEPPRPDVPDRCEYSCKKSGGCSVRYESAGFFTGSVQGSCFPPDFGGECSGTPDKCRDCIGVCGPNRGMKLVFTLDEDGKPGSPEVTALESKRPSSEQGGGSGGGQKTCQYSCQPSGGCSVRVHSPGSFVSGSVLGSCFSPTFGGKCSGTPDGCQDCLGICKKNEDKGPEFSLPAN